VQNKILALLLSLTALASQIAVAQSEPVHAVIIAPAGASDTAITKLLAQKATATDPAALRIVATKVEEGPGFGSLTFLEFPSEVAYEQWRTQRGVGLVAPVAVKRLDVLVQHQGVSHNRSASVYKVNAYRSKVAASAYGDFAANYIAPLMEGQVEKGIMLDYAMYIERGAVGEALVWLVVEYRDAAAFAAADDIKPKVRSNLTANHAGYAKYDKTKDTLRDNVSETLAKFAP